jgi:hypothetical protein
VRRLSRGKEREEPEKGGGGGGGKREGEGEGERTAAWSSSRRSTPKSSCSHSACARSPA